MIDLSDARELAQSIRFSGDKSPKYDFHSEFNLKDHLYTNELLISESVTPDLQKSLTKVLNRLFVPSELVTAFVYASPEINATCCLGYRNECVVRFSSGLIDILSKEEFEFVAGHEIGHFLLGHAPSLIQEGSSIEDRILLRAQEISADRLGLIGCDSLNIAVKALLKTISGLTDRHLKFDVGAFISQLQKTSGGTSQSSDATHPSILIRCRALLWFSMHESYVNKTAYRESEISSLDSKVREDLDRYVDQSSRKAIEKAKEDVAIWVAASDIVQKKRFSKDDQRKFGDRFGIDTLNSLLNFFDNSNADEIEKAVQERLMQSRHDLKNLIPKSYEDELAIIRWD